MTQEDFEIAISQLEAGEFISVPDGLDTEDKFWEWLKNA